MHKLIESLLDPVADRRKTRRSLSAFGTVCHLNGGTPRRRMDGLVWDLSTLGVGLLLSEQPTRGDQLEGELLTEAGTSLVSVSMRVAHVRRLSTGDFFVGAQFATPLTETDIAPFVTPNLMLAQPVAPTAVPTETPAARGSTRERNVRPIVASQTRRV